MSLTIRIYSGSCIHSGDINSVNNCGYSHTYVIRDGYVEYNYAPVCRLNRNVSFNLICSCLLRLTNDYNIHCSLFYMSDFFSLRNVQLSINSLDNPPEPKLIGNTSSLFTGNSHDITCSTEYYWPENITFTWTLGEEELPGVTLPTRRHYKEKYWGNYPNNIATYSSRLNHSYNRCEKSRNLSCTVQVSNELHGYHSYSASTNDDMGCK